MSKDFVTYWWCSCIALYHWCPSTL